MHDPQDDPRAAYFDSISHQWDGWHDLDAEQRKLSSGLAELGVGPDETVVDIGCGTGNLTRALLGHLSPRGRVVAVDIAPRMLEIARGKIDDARARWLRASAEQLPLDDACCDRVICFSVWPHLTDPRRAAQELRRVLRPTGQLHIWHLASRSTINAIHAGAGEAVQQDLLVPAADSARLLEELGLRVDAQIDDEQRYLVTARVGASE